MFLVFINSYPKLRHDVSALVFVLLKGGNSESDVY